MIAALLVLGVWSPAPIDVLHAWDAQRAAAYAEGDAASLSHLYVPASVAGQRDIATLRAFSRSGWRVSAMQTQVFAVRARRSGDSLTLRLVDRTMSGVTGHGVCRRLPTPQPRQRTVTLRRIDGTWLVDSVSAR